MKKNPVIADAKDKLVQDVKEFLPIFNREPTIDEVITWAETRYSSHLHRKAIEEVIKRAYTQ